MRIGILFSLLFTQVVLAAPPLILPSGLTPQQVIAYRQGADINARHTAAQNVIGSRADEFSTINPGSGQARSLFNNTVMSASNQVGSQAGELVIGNFSSVYKAFTDKGLDVRAMPLKISNPFPSNITKSQVQGLPFLVEKTLINSEVEARVSQSKSLHGVDNAFTVSPVAGPDAK